MKFTRLKVRIIFKRFLCIFECLTGQIRQFIKMWMSNNMYLFRIQCDNMLVLYYDFTSKRSFYFFLMANNEDGVCMCVV